jgi:hypothetical protein
MDRLAEYSIGCGTTMIVAGIISMLVLLFGRGETNNETLQVLGMLGELFGSQFIAAGAFSLIGVVLILTGSRIKRRRQRRRMSVISLEEELVIWQNESVIRYMNFVDVNLRRNQFDLFPFSPKHVAYRNSEYNSQRESFFIFEYVQHPLTVEKAREISQWIFKQTSRKKRSNALFCYPVILTETVSGDVQKFVQSYTPKHFGRFEFPVIVELSTGRLYYFGGSSIWGLAMYPELRKEAENILHVPVGTFQT